jgi:hypothetical protein
MRVDALEVAQQVEMERATRGRPSPNDNLGRSESAIQEAAFKVASGVGLRSYDSRNIRHGRTKGQRQRTTKTLLVCPYQRLK